MTNITIRVHGFRFRQTKTVYFRLWRIIMKNINRWFYVCVGVVALLIAGLVYAWSVMSRSIAASRPNWSTAQISMTFTIVMTFFCIGGLVSGILIHKISAKLFLIISAILFLGGFLIASMTGNSPISLYIGFGVVCGLAAGFAYNTTMSTISAWFPDKQGLVSGVLLMGFGLSSFIIGKVFAAVTPSDGSDLWKRNFLIIGIIGAIVLGVCSFFYCKPNEEQIAQYKKLKGSNKVDKKEEVYDVSTSQMIKKPTFWFYYIWSITIGAAGLTLVSQASGIAAQTAPAATDGTIATVVGMISIFNGLGRVFFGGLYDKKGFKVTMFLDIAVLAISGGFLILAIKNSSFLFLIIGFVFGGLGYSGVSPTNSALISEFFGRKYYPVNFPLTNTNLIIASFASTIAGKLYDSSHSYMSTIFMMLVITAVGFVSIFGVKRPTKESDY